MRSIWLQIPVILGAAALGAVAIGAGCSVSFDEDARYVCASDGDCGGDGYRCVVYAGVGGSCCKPSGEETCDGRDNDCDGVVDRITRDCYTGPAETRKVGICQDGKSSCVDGVWDEANCVGERTPMPPEICDGRDNDCDGATDEGAVCEPG